MRTDAARPIVEAAAESNPAAAWVPGHSEERGIKLVALGAALTIHVLVLMLNLPAFRGTVPRRPPGPGPIVVQRYVPPPPAARPPSRAPRRSESTRKIPIPDPTPDMLEPIREPAAEVEASPLPSDVDVLIGFPSPPPTGDGRPGTSGPGPLEPLIPGGDVTSPVRIEESYVRPEYPEMARLARIQANVVLQAIIDREGAVRDVQVLRCSQPGFGFEEASTVAVRQWRYEPATQAGLPVTVYFSILVDFSLL